MFAAFQAGDLLTIVPMGMVADRYSPRYTVSLGAIGTGIVSLLFAVFASGFYDGMALRLIAGMFIADVYVPGMRFVSD